MKLNEKALKYDVLLMMTDWPLELEKEMASLFQVTISGTMVVLPAVTVDELARDENPPLAVGELAPLA